MQLDERSRDYLMVLPGGVILFGLWPLVGQGKAFATAMCFGVFYVLISRNWEKRREIRFWLVMGGFFVLHLVGLWFIRFPPLKAGLIAFPFALADGLLMYGILTWIDRMFPSDDGRQ